MIAAGGVRPEDRIKGQARPCHEEITIEMIANVPMPGHARPRHGKTTPNPPASAPVQPPPHHEEITAGAPIPTLDLAPHRDATETIEPGESEALLPIKSMRARSGGGWERGSFV